MLYIVQLSVKKWLRLRRAFAQTVELRLLKFCITTATTVNTGLMLYLCVARVMAYAMPTQKGLHPKRSALTYPGAKAPLLFD